MPLFDQIDRDLVTARKERDHVRLSTLGLLKTEVVKAAKEPGATWPDDQLVLRVIRKEVKRRKEAAEAYASAGRTESASKEEAEAAVLLSYLPAQISDEELERQLKAVIEQVRPQGQRDFGAVMKAASAQLAGRAEGGRIAAVVRSLIGS
ncbi:MAG TPA: GatB/YqeY domain-containing protein [Candidatus Dormibacteraeota bacterium]|nr:GatB/YqeY domain-containing protein [Candidatus Dormibacteraeota bacterium]